jgi:hypothetical protein
MLKIHARKQKTGDSNLLEAIVPLHTFKSAPAQKVLSTTDLTMMALVLVCFNEDREDSNWPRKFLPNAFFTLGRFIEITAIPSSAPDNCSTLTSIWDQ